MTRSSSRSCGATARAPPGDARAHRHRARRLHHLCGFALSLTSRRDEGTPTAEAGNIRRVGGRMALHQKAFHAASIGQHERADRQRRWNSSNKPAEALRTTAPRVRYRLRFLRRRRATIPAWAAWCWPVRTADRSRRCGSLQASARQASATHDPVGMPERCAPTTASNNFVPVLLRSMRRRAWVGQRQAHPAEDRCRRAARGQGTPARHPSTGRQQCDAKRDGVFHHRRGNGEAAQVQQIDEVGVDAEATVEFDRVGQHLLDGIGRRHRRQQQDVDGAEDMVAAAAAAPRVCRRRQCVGRAGLCAGPDDLTRHRMQRVGGGCEQVARREKALRHPWVLVEKPCGLIKRSRCRSR